MRVTKRRFRRRVVLSTGPGIFTSQEERLNITSSPNRSFASIKYSDGSQAKAAGRLLRRKLKRSPEPSAVALKRCYSVATLMAFLRRHLDAQKTVAVIFEATVRSLGGSLACQLPEGTWLKIGARQVVLRGCSFATDVELVTYPTLESLARGFQLDSRSDHEWRTHVVLSASQFLDRADA